MTDQIAMFCLKAESERYPEICNECPVFGEVGCDHCFDDAMDVAIKVLEEVQQYRAIATPDECRAAVEKQKAKKPHKNYEKFSGVWCYCGSYLGVDKPNYCSDCGAKLDWSDEE